VAILCFILNKDFFKQNKKIKSKINPKENPFCLYLRGKTYYLFLVLEAFQTFIMNYFNVLTSIIFLVCTLSACKSETTEQVNNDKKEKTSKKVSTNKNPKDVQIMTKLEGVWQSNHEPAAIQFFEDGSYRRYIPAGQSDEADATEEEEHDNGSWTVDAGFLLLKSESGQMEKIVLSWVDDKLIYLGNIDEEHDPKFGSKEEFAAEFGFSKISD
jgi:hypothetical protein